MSHHNLGVVLKDLGQRPAAEKAYRRALDLYEQLAADFPAVPEYRLGLANSHNNLGNLLTVRGQLPAAERAYRRALGIREKLAADFPTMPEYRKDLPASYVNFGMLLVGQGQAEAGLAWYAKAITLLEPVVRQEPRLVAERFYLRNAHWGRAVALDGLGRHADAVKAWDRVLELNAVPAQESGFRHGRARSLARAGEHARAVAEANALAGANEVAAGTLYDLAGVCAVASAAVRDAKTPGADAARHAETYAARAVELLRQAVAKGYKDADRLNKDKDLDALRDREDFRKLVAELEKKQE
jgi:tetratricopeptide (TPR) repeat protein